MFLYFNEEKKIYYNLFSEKLAQMIIFLKKTLKPRRFIGFFKS